MKIPMDNFPEEMVTEILSRLPGKSLLRFKRVCKSWCNHISTKDFAFLHFNNYKPSDLVLAGIWPRLTLSTAFVTLSPPTRACAVEKASRFVCRSRIVHYPLPQQHDFDCFGMIPEVCGPCNGILCSYLPHYKDIIMLWNPQIQDFKIIPQSNLPRLQGPSFHYRVGFGFDSETNDCKILRIVQSPSVCPIKQQLELYSLDTNSWRKLDYASPLNSFCVSNVFSRYRKIGWLGQQRQILFLFDVSDETFDMIPVSLDGEFHSWAVTDLQVFPFRESIAVVISIRGYCEIWVLNDFSCCAQSRSWSKLWTIEVENLFWPLGFCGNSYLVFRGWNNFKLMLYDLLNHDVVDVGA